MGLDKNQVIGFLLIGILLIGFFVISNRDQKAFQAHQQHIADSIAKLKPVLTQSASPKQAVSLVVSQSAFKVMQGPEQFTTIENDVFKISFSNKGGQPHTLELKKYTTLDKKPVLLLHGGFDKLSYMVNSGNNHTESTSDLMFTPGQIIKNAEGNQSITYTAADTSGHIITHEYILKNNDYRIDCNITLQGSESLITGKELRFTWQAEAPLIEENFDFEKTQTHFCYFKSNGYDFENLVKSGEVKLDQPTDWVTLKQQFFAKSLISMNKFASAPTSWQVDTGSTFIARSITTATVKLPAGNIASIPLQLFYGPSDYNILKKYNNHLEEIVPYGSGLFSFVKYINRYILLPVFDFLQKNILNMGIVILLLTLLIRLITSPILYKSYLSNAKMKVLKPEVDQLRTKFTDPKTKQFDQQAFGLEQMKLWKSAGVNPLGGCIPTLLQIPIFMSLFYFFQSNIDLRGKAFLWAKDLASYDTIAMLPIKLPLYGDHVNLFTLLAVATSLLISIYGMSNMQDNSNPMMKYMPYIFPVILLGVFNKLPSALTWYYTVSNIITLLLQFVIQKYIINHDKILAEISENRKKPAKQSKFQERLQSMQASQRKLQEMKDKTAKK